MRIGQLLSWLVAGSQSVILLNRGGGRVGEQSVSLWKQGYKDEDYHCQRAFFVLICLDLHSLIYVESITPYPVQICCFCTKHFLSFFWFQLNGCRHDAMHL